MRAASIDVGSNSILLLVANIDAVGRWHRVEERAEVARISEGLDTHGFLQDAPVARALAVLEVFVARAKALHAEKIWLTGTAPFRRASNGAAVADAFREQLGLPFDIVSGEEEGALTLHATTASFPEFSTMCVLDIGGASTELLRWDASGTESQSIDVGVVRLLERYVRNDPPTEVELTTLREAIRAALKRSLAVPAGRWPLIGVAGTVTSLAALDLGLSSWDADRVQGHVLSLGSIRALAERLWSQSIEERCLEVGLDARRADVIAIGAWYLYEICTYLQVDSVVVSDRGLRWGRLFQEYEATK